MKTTKILILFMLLLVIGIAGCARGADDDAAAARRGDGIVITNIRTDFRTIEAEEDMTLAVNFENRGDRTAENISGSIIRKGSFMVNPIYVDATSSLEPPIEGTFSGDEFTWEISAPDVTESRTEQLQARLRYKYSTEAYADIHFVPRDILREMGDGAFRSTTTSTRGPLQIEIVSNQPGIIREDDVDELGCYGYAFNCGDVTEQTACNAIYDCSWSEDQCSGTEVQQCRDIEEESVCQAVTGDHPDFNVCGWGLVKDIRMTIIVTNIGNGRIEKITEEDGIEEDIIEKLTVEAFGGPACVLHEEYEVGTSPTPLRRGLRIDFGDTRLIGGEKAQMTFTNRFIMHETQAATSCQIRVTADYGYRVDSPIHSITVEPKL